MCLLRNSINHRNSEKHWLWASLYSDHLWSHRIPSLSPRPADLWAFSSPARWVPWIISPQPAPKATAIFSYSNSQKSTNSTKIKNHLQKSLTIFKHRQFLFKNVQKSPNFRKFVRWLVTKIWAFWKTSCKGSSKKKLCNTKPPTKPKSTGNTMEIRRILNLFCDAQRKPQMSQIHRNLHRKSCFPANFRFFL